MTLGRAGGSSIWYSVWNRGNSPFDAIHFRVMHVLALDFDGVICDSSREVFVVAVDTYADLEPGSGLLEQLEPLREDAVAGGGEYRNAPIYQRFRDLLPLGNRAEDFGVSLRAIDEGAAIGDQAAYDSFYRQLGHAWLDSFHSRFYECRGSLRETDPEGWLRLHLPYPGLAEALRRHRDRTRPAVATAKDSRSVQVLLEALGFGGVFDPELILDKETGVEKTHHLRALQERTGAEYSDITFVDDKVNHLRRVAELGVRPVLAGWGFNSDREHELARELGYEVASLSTLDEVLFKGE
jgi:phosphoglycolate phosphatase-like HAD superfamily hydrolase